MEDSVQPVALLAFKSTASWLSDLQEPSKLSRNFDLKNYHSEKQAINSWEPFISKLRRSTSTNFFPTFTRLSGIHEKMFENCRGIDPKMF